MAGLNSLKSKSPEFWILLGIPVLFIIGGLMHFVYDLSGNLTLAGIFAPVNESVWEHLKMTYWPMLLWWIIGYYALGKGSSMSPTQWFVSSTVAQLTCLLVIVSFHYTYTGALGIESLILDIFSLLLGIACGQGLALHVYRKASFNIYWLYISIIVLILLAAAFIVFTFYPPHIPLFKDSLTGKYGI